ncbi:phosphoglycerate mutase family protein [Cryptosporidium serpentis]
MKMFKQFRKLPLFYRTDTIRFFFIPSFKAVPRYNKALRLLFFSVSSVTFGGAITLYILSNYGYYFKDTIPWNSNWDIAWNTLSTNLDSEESKDFTKEPKRWHKILLVRHGQYKKESDDEDNMNLTEKGRKQAELTGIRLAEQFGGRVNAIYHSNLIRAKETANIISNYFPGVKLIEDSNLAEGVPIAPDPPIVGYEPTSKEIAEDSVRINKAFQTYFVRPSRGTDDNKVDIIVCHGNVIRYMFCKGLQFPTNGWLRLGHLNCGVTSMAISSESNVVCYGFGDAGHLSPDLQTHN